jgi:hypothetical protein
MQDLWAELVKDLRAEPAQLVDWIVTVFVTAMVTWALTRLTSRPKLRFKIRESGVNGPGEPVLRFEVANGGPGAAALYPVVTAKFIRVNISRRAWAPSWLVRWLGEERVARSRLRIAYWGDRASRGSLEVVFDIDQNVDLHLPPFCGARLLSAVPRVAMDDWLDAPVYSFKVEGRRRPITLYFLGVPGIDMKSCGRFRYLLARLMHAVFDYRPRRKTSGNQSEWEARRRARD